MRPEQVKQRCVALVRACGDECTAGVLGRTAGLFEARIEAGDEEGASAIYPSRPPAVFSVLPRFLS